MKLFYKKLALCMLFAISSTASAKVYYDQNGNKLFNGKDFPVLDLVICLDKYKFNGKEWIHSEKYADLATAPITSTLINTIEQEEALVACSNLIRKLIDKAATQSIDGTLCKNVITTLNDHSMWLIFLTKDQEFVLFIPRKKYAVSSPSDLKALEINTDILQELKSLDSSFYNESELKQQKRLDELALREPTLKTKGLIQHETLFALFLQTPETNNITKHIIMAGHGNFHEQIKSTSQEKLKLKKPQGPTETDAAIAQLRPYQYIQFLELLKKISCSLLYIKSCYSSGFNALMAKNETFYQEKNIFAQFRLADDLPFIIVNESTPDVSAGALLKSKIAAFFTQINSFFLQKKNRLKEHLGQQKITCSEQDLLTGKLLTPPLSIIEQKPWLINTLAPIIENLRTLSANNYSTARFPGMPFFRFIEPQKNPDSLQQLSILQQKKTDATQKLEAQLASLTPDSPEFNNAIEEYQKLIRQWDDEIEKLETPLRPLVLSNQFLVHYELKHRKDKNPSLTIQDPTQYALLYPSVIALPITIKSSIFRIISMIPGRAQHYFTSLTFECDPALTFNKLDTIFAKIQQEPVKLYFIKNLTGLADKNALSHVCIKTNDGKASIIYQDEDNKYYNELNKELNEQTARTTIKQWVLETTPAHEALFESSAGIENIYKFRIKISPIFKGMFTREELGKKPESSKTSTVENQ